MNRKLNVVIILFFSVILISISCFPNVSGYTDNGVTTGQMHYNGAVIGKYGCVVVYDNPSGLNDAQFVPTLEVKTNTGWFVSSYKITVSGTDPKGQPISGIEFENFGHLISPAESGYEWLGGYTKVFNILANVVPYGLGGLIKSGIPNGGFYNGYYYDDSQEATSAWASWAESGVLLVSESGMQFAFHLHCNSDLPGIYTLNFCYHITLRFPGVMGGGPIFVSQDVYQTVTYEFRAPPDAYASSIYSYSNSGPTSGISNPNNLLGSSIDGQVAHLHAGDPISNATIIANLNTQTIGHVYLYGYSSPGYYTHIRVYVSSDASNWFKLADKTVSSSTPQYIDCGASPSYFSYIKIMALDDTGMSAALNVDTVSIFNSGGSCPINYDPWAFIPQATADGWLFTNTYTGYARCWIPGSYMGGNTATLIVKTGSQTVYVEENGSYGQSLAIASNTQRSITTSASGIWIMPGHSISPTPGSEFARIDGTDLNFWLAPGASILIYNGGTVGNNLIVHS